MKYFPSVSTAHWSMFLLISVLIPSINVAHSDSNAIQQQKQTLTRLYAKASAEKGLWKGVPELYQQAISALEQDDQEQFSQLYPSLQFKLSKGLEQAESQTPAPLMPPYLK